MGVKENRFKAALDGSVERRIFKAKLMGQTMFIDKDLKLIVPLVDFTDLTSFAKGIHKFPDMEWNNQRMHHGAIVHGYDTIFETVTREVFYLHQGWTVYDKNRHYMRFAGWVEADEQNRMAAVYNYFIPLGLYDHTKSFFELHYKDGTEKKIYLPEYCEDASRTNGFLIETFQAKGLWYCTTGSDGVTRSAPIASLVGHSVDRFATKGHVIKFPAGHMG